MKAKKSNDVLASLRDGAIITAAGATIVGTLLWLKQGKDARELAMATGDEQQKMRVALERLAATLERIETQVQTLSLTQQSNESLGDAVALNGTAPKPPVRRRAPGSPKTSRSRNAAASTLAPKEAA